MSNNISFIGNLAADAELKTVGSNTVLEFRVANNVGFGDRRVTNWFRCSLWGRRGESIHSYMVKGKTVFVTGELTLRNYTANDGQERTSPDVNVNNVSFAGRDSDSRGDAPPAQETSSNSAPPPPAGDDDKVPF